MNTSFFKHNDWVLIITTFLLAIFGLMMVFSASYMISIERPGSTGFYYFFQRQSMWLALGVVAFFIIMHFPYRFYSKLVVPMLMVAITCLVLVLFMGLEEKGATRWLSIGPFSFQPSELVKVVLVIYLASVYSRKRAYINQFIRGVLPPLVIVGIVFSLIMLQPDLGTATAILLVTLLIVFFSGAKWRHLIGLSTLGIILFVVFATSEEYRMNRLTAFIDPFNSPLGEGLQLIQSYIAIAHGGVLGTGLGQSVQKLFYLPEAHTDFILAVIAEELGFFGVAFVMIGYGILLFRGVAIGTRCKNPFGSLLAFGITFQIAIQVVFNVGAISGMLPITGITLPLISSGGSSLLVTLASLAILANISRATNRQRKEKELVDSSSLQAS